MELESYPLVIQITKSVIILDVRWRERKGKKWVDWNKLWVCAKNLEEITCENGNTFIGYSYCQVAHWLISFNDSGDWLCSFKCNIFIKNGEQMLYGNIVEAILNLVTSSITTFEESLVCNF